MADPRMIYLKAAPEFFDLDHEDGGKRFSEKLKEISQKESSAATIVLDFSGNVRLDYWGCSEIINTCVGILRERGISGERTIKVITSLRYAEKENYAWLFFNKSTFKTAENSSMNSHYEIAKYVCREQGLVFHVHKVSLKYKYEPKSDGLGDDAIVLSS